MLKYRNLIYMILIIMGSCTYYDPSKHKKNLNIKFISNTKTKLSELKKLAPKDIINNYSDEVAQLITIMTAIVDNFQGAKAVDKNQLLENAIIGMVKGLKDPYSQYFSKEELQELELLDDECNSNYIGIGLSFAKVPYTAMLVVDVMGGSPADEAGLAVGDIITSIDGKSTYFISYLEALKRVKGLAGSKVKLSVLRDGETLNFSFKRVKYNVKSVFSKIIDGYSEIGYIKVKNFHTYTAQLVKAALNNLISKNIKFLILDLRDNPGGQVEEAIETASLFIKNSPIIIQESRGDKIFHKAKGIANLDIPLALLVDKNTASAAEIVAAAIKDYKRGVIFGATTYGKGVGQAVLYLEENDNLKGAIKITTSRFLTPQGRQISNVGIEPNVYINVDSLGIQEIIEQFNKHNVASEEEYYSAITERIKKNNIESDKQLHTVIKLIRRLNVEGLGTMME